MKFGTPMPTGTMAFAPRLPPRIAPSNRYAKVNPTMSLRPSNTALQASKSESLFEEVDPQKMSRNPALLDLNIMEDFDLLS